MENKSLAGDVFFCSYSGWLEEDFPFVLYWLKKKLGLASESTIKFFYIESLNIIDYKNVEWINKWV